MLPAPDKLMRLLGQLAPQGKAASVKDVLRSALSVLDGVKAKAGAPAYPCLAPASAMPDLSALMRKRKAPGTAPTPDAPGAFTDHVLATPGGSYAYKLYEPSGAAPPVAVLVMLHGCTQSAADFAAGTRMNAVAEAHNVLVVYPEQPGTANMQRCWNWFDPRHQRTGTGEPAAIAAITRAVMADHAIPAGHAFVAGLSAGGAMAAVLGETDPDLFSAVGIHSGLPAGAAHDIPSALSVMREGARVPPLAASATAVPTIVFHGDADHTVSPANATAIVGRLTARERGLRQTTTTGRAAGGHAYSRTAWTDAAGRERLETWTVAGAGHAWAGGSVAGSYADPAGPDASAEMMRFFLAQLAPRPAIRPAAIALASR